MADSEQIAEVSASIEEEKLKIEKIEAKTFWDYFSLALTTCGVGYLPLAPGTWGSIVGVFIYLIALYAANIYVLDIVGFGFSINEVIALGFALSWVLFLILCYVGIKTSKRAAKLFGNKDPQKIVIDEVMGQLLVFLFVPPLQDNLWLVFVGFLLFRLFDITKPYPIRYLEVLPDGIGVCADDLLAGIYGGVCLSIIYAISLTF